MPRCARQSIGGIIYHVLNRANSRRRLFYSENDYLAFGRVLIEACGRFPGVKIFSLCIMPNHWHLVLRCSKDGELSQFMRWLAQTHTQRWRHAKHTVGYGALYQGRFKSFMVQEDRHFLILCRYVERNALAAKLASRAEAWRWGSAWMRDHPDDVMKRVLSDWPVDRPSGWLALLNEPTDEKQKSAVKTSILRNRPLGEDAWVRRMSKRYGIEHTLRPPGRPRKTSKKR